MAYVDRECALVTLDRTSAASGEFVPSDKDDKRYAKWLEERGLFTSVARRGLNGRNQVVYKLTASGRTVWQSRRDMRLDTFKRIAAKHAAEMAAE